MHLDVSSQSILNHAQYAYVCISKKLSRRRGSELRDTTTEEKLVLSRFTTPSVPEIKRLLGLRSYILLFQRDSQLNSALFEKIRPPPPAIFMIIKIVQNECKLKKKQPPTKLIPLLSLLLSLSCLDSNGPLLLGPQRASIAAGYDRPLLLIPWHCHAPFLPLDRPLHALHCCHGVPYDFLPS